MEQPRIHHYEAQIGSCTIKFAGEQWEGERVLDTKVTINDEELCWIQWDDKEQFVIDLKRAIEPYFI